MHFNKITAVIRNSEILCDEKFGLKDIRTTYQSLSLSGNSNKMQ